VLVGVNHVNYQGSLQDSVVEGHPLAELVLTSAYPHNHVSGLEDAGHLHSSDEVEFGGQVEDGDADVFLLDQLGDSLVQLVALLGLELDWGLASKHHVALPFDFFGIKLSLSCQSLLLLSDDLFVSFDSSLQVLQFFLARPDNLFSLGLVISLKVDQSLPHSGCFGQKLLDLFKVGFSLLGKFFLYLGDSCLAQVSGLLGLAQLLLELCHSVSKVSKEGVSISCQVLLMLGVFSFNELVLRFKTSRE